MGLREWWQAKVALAEAAQFRRREEALQQCADALAGIWTLYDQKPRQRLPLADDVEVFSLAAFNGIRREYSIFRKDPDFALWPILFEALRLAATRSPAEMEEAIREIRFRRMLR